MSQSLRPLLEVDRVVDQGLGYLLVEKTTEVDRVVAFDPRTRGEQ